MRCYIGYLLSEEFQEQYQKIVRDIGQRFSLERLIQKRRLAHITFQSPFETDSISQIEELISSFCESQKPSEIKVRGIGSFGNQAMYLDVQPSEAMINTFRAFLEKFNPLLPQKANSDKKLHITLTKFDELEGRFQEIYDYLSNQDISFVLPFDNITIFQKNGSKTSVYKTYFLMQQS